MNRLWKHEVDELQVNEGRSLSVRFKGVNTVNGIWVLDLSSNEFLARAGCRVGQRASIDLGPLPPGLYQIGHSGCWTRHSLILHILERRK